MEDKLRELIRNAPVIAYYAFKQGSDQCHIVTEDKGIADFWQREGWTVQELIVRPEV